MAESVSALVRPRELSSRWLGDWIRKYAGCYAHGNRSKGNRALRGMAAGGIEGRGASRGFDKYVKQGHIKKKNSCPHEKVCGIHPWPGGFSRWRTPIQKEAQAD